MDLSWMKEIDGVERLLDKDMKLVYENCGIETVINLLENLPSINVYISKAAVTRAQETYILKHFNGRNVKEIAIKIGCSEMRVYQVIKNNLNQVKKPDNQVRLFNE